MSPLELIGAVCLLIGAFFCVTGSVGLLRFPDFYSRLHAAGVTDTSGAGFIFLGLILYAIDPGEGGIEFKYQLLLVVKLVAILFFMWVSGTTACHALAKAAFLDGLEPWTNDEEGEPSSS